MAGHLSGISHLIDAGIAYAERIGVTGTSYGGFMASWLPSLEPRLKAAVAQASSSNWTSQRWGSNIGAFHEMFIAGRGARRDEPWDRLRDHSPVFVADRIETPILLTAGTNDRCVLPTQAVGLFRALGERNVSTAVVTYPGEGHGINSFPAILDLETRILDWFERFMPGVAAEGRAGELS